MISNYRNYFRKYAALLLTPEAQAAAAQPPPPQDPAMMAPQGMPQQDPSMMGASMDPAMMAPQGMPQQAGMDPLSDPEFVQFLQMAGAQVDPSTGAVIGPDGTQIPPEQLQQLYMQFDQQRQAQMAAGGAQAMPPQDPAMMGAPMDPSMMAPQGMPALDPAMMAQDPQMIALQEAAAALLQMNQLVSVIVLAVDDSLNERMSALDKKISAFALKLDTIKAMIDDMALNKKAEDSFAGDQLNDLLLQELANPVVLPAQLIPKVANLKGGSILLLMRG